MGILADQALQRLRNVEAQERVRTGEPSPLSEERSANLLRVAIIGAAFLLLASAAFLARPNFDINERTAAELPKNRASTGRATFPLADGINCRDLVFDQTKGDIVNSNTAPCDSISRRTAPEPERGNTTTGFSWGRK